MKTIYLSDYYQSPCGESNIVIVSDEIFELLLQFSREYQNEKKRRKRHIAAFPYVDGFTSHRHGSPKPVEDAVLNNILKQSIFETFQTLTATQRRRAYLFFFGFLTQQEIAVLEGVSKQEIQKTISGVIRKIKKISKTGCLFGSECPL